MGVPGVRLVVNTVSRTMTVKTPVWRLYNSSYMRQNPLMDRVEQALRQNEELDSLATRSVGKDPNKVFCLHAVSPHVSQRFDDMVVRGETIVYQGSGRMGFIDALYAYVLTGQGSGNKPFQAFTNPESISKILAIFAGKTDRSTVVFRSSELPDL